MGSKNTNSSSLPFSFKKDREKNIKEALLPGVTVISVPGFAHHSIIQENALLCLCLFPSLPVKSRYETKLSNPHIPWWNSCVQQGLQNPFVCY